MKNTWLVGVIAAVVLSVYLLARAQEAGPIPYQGQNVNRYQMFFSPVLRKSTFLADTSNGIVWRLVRNKESDDARLERALVTPQPASTPGGTNGRFVIFVSPVKDADIYLVDTNTGMTWQLREDTAQGHVIFRQVRRL